MPFKLLISLLLPLQVFAANLQDVEFEDKIKVDGQELVLNGLGLRLATLFKVKVYVAGIYLTEKQSSWEEIKKLKGPKKIRLAFLMGVDKEKLQDAWKDTYRANLDSDTYEKVSSSVGKMNRYMKSMKKGDNMEMVLIKDKVEIWLKGKKVATIEDKAFAKHFLAGFIGPNPPNDELKEGLLGKSES